MGHSREWLHFFASENNISIEELEQMLKLTEEEIKNEKDQ